MKAAFLIVSIILFVLDTVMYWLPTTPWGGRLQSLGLAFFAASFAASA